MQAVILAGGLGTRLRSVVNDRPKPMALVNGKPFLEYQLNFLKNQGIKDVLLLCGFMADKIQEYFGNGEKWDLKINYSIEDEPKGTGGAILNAYSQLEKRFLLLNGDTFINFNLSSLTIVHETKRADITILVRSAVGYEQRYGTLSVDANSKIVLFKEKDQSRSNLYVNCGVYTVEKCVFQDCQLRKFSFEEDILMNKVNKLSIYACITNAGFIDIGTPDSYKWFVDASRKRALDV